MPTRSSSRAANYGGIAFQKVVSQSYQGAQVADETVPIAQAGTLTTRTSNTAGVITLNNSAIPTFNTGAKVVVSWIDGSGNLQYCWNGTVTVSGSTITITGLSGTVLPAAAYAVNVSQILKQPMVIASTGSPLAATVNNSQVTGFMAVGLTAQVDNATPNTTAAIATTIVGSNAAFFMESVGEYTINNASFATADTVYMANLSLTTSANVQVAVANP